jgi:hypothetical protein
MCVCCLYCVCAGCAVLPRRCFMVSWCSTLLCWQGSSRCPQHTWTSSHRSVSRYAACLRGVLRIVMGKFQVSEPKQMLCIANDNCNTNDLMQEPQ